MSSLRKNPPASGNRWWAVSLPQELWTSSSRAWLGGRTPCWSAMDARKVRCLPSLQRHAWPHDGVWRPCAGNARGWRSARSPARACRCLGGLAQGVERLCRPRAGNGAAFGRGRGNASSHASAGPYPRIGTHACMRGVEGGACAVGEEEGGRFRSRLLVTRALLDGSGVRPCPPPCSDRACWTCPSTAGSWRCACCRWRARARTGSSS